MPATDSTRRETSQATATSIPSASRSPAGLAPSDFKTLFESLPALVLVLDPDLHIVAATNAYLEATLTGRDDIIGRHLFEVFPDNPDDPSADSLRNTRASMQRVLQNRVPDTMVVQRHDVRRPASAGGGFEERYWSPVNSPVLNDDGSLAYIIHRVENVTEFVQMKQQGVEQAKMSDALREQAVQMEADLYVRSREVADANARMKQAHDELARLYEKTRELDELKTRFFANVSHELRTPLTLMLGPLNRLLQQAGLTAEVTHGLGVIRRNALLLQRHVDDLLDIAKLEAGRMQLLYTPVDLAQLVRIAASYFQAAAADRQIQLNVITPAELYAEVDVGKIERVLINLLSNALKFTPDSGVVQLMLTGDDERLRIDVIDNGPGIPASMRESVFDRFSQADGSAECRQRGTGLGLAIVREFAILHRGHASVNAAAGGGAHFPLDLPRTAPAGTAVAEPVTTTSAAMAKMALVASEQSRAPALQTSPSVAVAGDVPHILVAEDHRDLNEFLVQALRPYYRVTSAYDGREALALALADPPDLILSDLMMPRMDGERLVDALRRHRVFDDVPVVIISAKDDEALRIRLLRSSVQAYLNKPFSVDEVLARVGGLLAEQQRARFRLRRSEARFRATFEQAAVGIAHVAPDGHWLLVNQTLCDIIGYTRSELLMLSFQEITHPQDLDADLALVRQLLVGEIPHYSLEKRYLHKSGAPVWVRLTVALVRDSDGQADYFIVVVEDIRVRKRAEDEIAQLNASLERRVEERTAELQAANRELDSFSYAVSHDLRAPLRAIRGFSEALADDFDEQLPAGARVFVDQIRQAGQRMHELIDGLLALSRSTLAELQQDDADVSAMATAILAELAQTDPRRQVRTQVERDLRVQGDARMIDVLLRNLIGNAWKYTQRTPQPLISVVAEQRDGIDYVCVTDNGAGFDRAFAGSLFRPFQRLHSQEDFPGTGIGLATVQRIVQRHGGRLLADGEPERGAHFCFHLPRRG